MALTLYVGNKRYSSWSLRGYLILSQTGARFETVTILLNLATTRDEILKISPAARVPILDHDGLVIWDTLAIAEYAHELFPEAGLWPADRTTRARARSISAEMHSGFAALRENMPADLIAKQPGVGHTPEALDDARRIQDIWRAALDASGGPFLFGALSIADAMFAPVVTRFATYGVEIDETARAYSAAIEALPAMRAWRADAAAEPE